MDTTLYEFDPLEPGDPRTVGGYGLRARIGEGGMGRVFLSFTPGGRAVAVKLIRGELASDPEFRERFAREVSIAQQVNGIHIAQLIDAGTDRGVPWLASAYVAGPSLAQVVSACGPLPPATVLALAGRIAESLGAIHATGMVHRDLKPGNILLDESGPKVIDFGIVRAATPTATGRSSHRTFIGSPPFMAPEQIRGRKVTPATDVFALGATIYYLATGESAFQADFADGVLYRVMHDEPDYDACPEQVRELVRACLLKEPEERPSTQRIIDGCRTAGAGPQTPLPDAVRAMIQARSQALAILASASRPADDAAAVGEIARAEQETAPEPLEPGRPTAIPTPLPAASTTAPGTPTEPLTAPDPQSAPTMLTGPASSIAPTVPTPAASTAPAAPAASAAEFALAPPPPSLPSPSADPSATTVPNAGSASSAAPGRGRRGRTFVVAASSSLVTAVIAVIVAATLWPSHSTNTAGTDQVHRSTSASTKTATQPTNTATGATTPPATPTTPATTPSTPNASDSATIQAVSGSDLVQYQGSVLIGSSYVDLDSVPVDNGAGTIQSGSVYDSTAAFVSSQYTLTAPSGSGLLATWSGSASPTRSQCYDQVSSQGVSEVTVTNGTLVCVITPADRVALLKVTNDAADNNDGIQADVTVWSQIASAPASSG